MAKRAWDRLEKETPTAYTAFTAYYQMPADERSIDAAWRAGAKEGQNRDGKRAPTHWGEWSAKFDWVKRAEAHDDYAAKLEEEKWEKRRLAMRERDWKQAEAIRDLVDAALPTANQFIRRQVTRIPARGDEPAREVITLAFNIGDLARVVEIASRMEHLATDEPTDNIRLSGAALDDVITRELAALADRSKKGDAATPARDATGGNAG